MLSSCLVKMVLQLRVGCTFFVRNRYNNTVVNDLMYFVLREKKISLFLMEKLTVICIAAKVLFQINIILVMTLRGQSL